MYGEGVVVDISVSETEFVDVAVTRALLDGDAALRARPAPRGTEWHSLPRSAFLALVELELVFVGDRADGVAQAIEAERGAS